MCEYRTKFINAPLRITHLSIKCIMEINTSLADLDWHILHKYKKNKAYIIGNVIIPYCFVLQLGYAKTWH